MIRLIILLAIISAFIFVVKLIMDYRSVDRPQRIGRKEAQAVLADNQAMHRVLNEIDAQARAEQMINSTNNFAWSVSNEIAKARKELA